MTRHAISVDTDQGAGFPCAEDVNVLAAMERARRSSIPVGCRNGGCGACKVRVLSGAHHTAKMNRAVVSEADQAAGCVLACKLFPRADLSLQVLGRAWNHARPTPSTSSGTGFTRAAPSSHPEKEI